MIKEIKKEFCRNLSNDLFNDLNDLFNDLFVDESIFIIKFDLTNIIFGGDLGTFFIIEFLNEGDKF
jgi:hypothetical protein